MPYDVYGKTARSVPGQCLDVKADSNIELSALFADGNGYYEFAEELDTPAGGSSCQLDPSQGLVIPVVRMKKIPSVCVRGKVEIENAKSWRFELGMRIASGPGMSEGFIGSLGETSRNGEFCLNHVPADRPVFLSFKEKKSRFPFLSFLEQLSPVSELNAEDTAPESLRFAYFKIQPTIEAGFSCEQARDQCFDVGVLKGRFPRSEGERFLNEVN